MSMQLNDVTADRLRRLAEIEAEGRTVISVVLNLDPREFATPPARETAIRSLLDDAGRRVRALDDLSHDEQRALREGLERLEAYFADDFSAEGAHALAVFVSAPDDLLEVVRLPRPADSQVAIGSTPNVEPLARAGVRERWAVVLVSRAAGRLLRGSADWLSEVADLDEDVHGQHDQGGWSQARYQRSVDQEAHEHVEHVLATLARSDAHEPYDRLLVAAPEEVYPYVERHLDDRMRERFAGRVPTDVTDAGDADVLEAARPIIAEDVRRGERELLDRLAEGLGTGGRAAAGLDAVREALEQARVETVLVGQATEVPLDVVRAAVTQAADVVYVRHHDDLDAHGGIAALLRF